MPDPFSKKLKEEIARLGNPVLNEIFNVDGKHWCDGCDTPIQQFELFCMGCGTKNPPFSPEELKRELGFETIEEAKKKGCPEWHTPNPEVADHKFCPFCGLNIFEQTLGSIIE